MNFNYLKVVGLLILLTACHTKESKTGNLDKKVILTQNEINLVMDNWLELWETYDLLMLNNIFLQTGELTYFSSETEGLIHGFDQLRPHHKNFGFVEGGKQPEKSLWLEDIETRIYGETALVAAIWFFGDQTITKDSVQYGPVTFILKKDDRNELKIIHTHFANY